MPFQSNSRILAAINREATHGVAAGAAGAQQIRITDSPGLKLSRATIQANEKRSDALKTMARLGGKSVGGSYNGELSIGGVIDLLLESIMRGAWSATFASALGATDGTTTASSIVRATGSFLADGWRVGDVATITGDATAANNNLRLRVKAVTATTLTLHGTPLTLNATARALTVTRAKKVINPAAPIRYSHTVEQYDQDIDVSELFLGCRLVGLQINCPPNAQATWQATFMGLDRTLLATGTSPYFAAPAVTTGLGLVADDSSISYDGSDVTNFTGFSLNFQIAANGQPVIGSVVSPEVFDNDLMISGTVSGLRSDFSNLSKFDAETEFEMGILLYEPGAAPKNFLSLYFTRVKVTDVDAPFGGGDGAKVETRQITVGPKLAAAGYDGTYAVICSSAAL